MQLKMQADEYSFERKNNKYKFLLKLSVLVSSYK